MSRTEKDVVAAVRAWLTLNGIPHWVIHTKGIAKGGGYVKNHSMKGMADILGILPGGRFLAVEVKKPGGRVKPEQWEFIRAVRDAGGLGLVVHDVDELEQDIAGAIKPRLRA